MADPDSIDHVVLVMLENRWFDHVLGFLYPKSDNFDGLDGTESNPDTDGNEARIFQITPGIQNAYYSDSPTRPRGTRQPMTSSSAWTPRRPRARRRTTDS
jgi:phospholipase C